MATIKEQLDKQLRDRIAGMFDGEKFPTEAELCKEFSVSRMTVNKALHEIVRDGLLIRTPGRGTFVRKPHKKNLNDAEKWLSDSYFNGMVFTPMPQKLHINIHEYQYEIVRSMWDKLLAEFRKDFPKIEVKISTEPRDGVDADIIWAANRKYLNLLNIDAFNSSKTAIDAIAEVCPDEDYFACGWKDLRREKVAGCPFIFSTGLCLWNSSILKKVWSGNNGNIPKGLYDFYRENINSPVEKLPPVIPFSVPYLLMQMVSAGILEYDRANGLSGFENLDAAEFIKFNKKMFQQVANVHNGLQVIDFQSVLKLLLSGDILMMNTFSSTLRMIPENRHREFSVNSVLVGECAPTVPIYMGIGKNSRNIKIAATAIAFFCGEKAQRVLSQSYNNVPALKKVAYSWEFLRENPHNMLQIIEILDKAKDIVNPMHFFEKQSYYCEEIYLYILGQISLSDLMSNINRKLEVCNA